MIDYDAVLESVSVIAKMPEAVVENYDNILCSHNTEALFEYNDSSSTIAEEISEVRVSETLDESGKVVEQHITVIEANTFDLEIAKSKLDANSVTQLVGLAKLLEVDTDVNAKKAVSMALQAKKIVNQMEKTRKKIIRPMLDFNKAVSDYSKDLTKCLKDMEESLLAKIEVYQGKRKESLESQNIIDNSMDKITVEDGTVTEHKAWVFDIEDISAIPLEYMEVAERAIKEAIRKGIRTIPGIKIYEKTSIRSRVK